MTPEERLDRLEAIARAHGLHEPQCPVYVAEAHNARGLTYMAKPPCGCWLAGT